MPLHNFLPRLPWVHNLLCILTSFCLSPPSSSETSWCCCLKGNRVIEREREREKRDHRFWAKFRLFSAHFLPIFRLWYPISCFSAYMFAEFAYFHLFSAYFPPKMVPYPCYKLKHRTHLPFFHPYIYGFCWFSSYVPLIFRLTFRPFSPVLSCWNPKNVYRCF